MESALSSKGQATIPKPVRDYLRIGTGDRIKFFLHPDGTVVILPKAPTAALKGIARTKGKHAASLEEMETAVESGATRKFRARR